MGVKKHRWPIRRNKPTKSPLQAQFASYMEARLKTWKGLAKKIETDFDLKKSMDENKKADETKHRVAIEWEDEP